MTSKLTNDQLLKALINEMNSRPHVCIQAVEFAKINNAISANMSANSELRATVIELKKAVFGNGSVGLAEVVRQTAGMVQGLVDRIEAVERHPVELKSNGGMDHEKIDDIKEKYGINWIWFKDKILPGLVVAVLVGSIVAFGPDLLSTMSK